VRRRRNFHSLRIFLQNFRSRPPKALGTSFLTVNIFPQAPEPWVALRKLGIKKKKKKFNLFRTKNIGIFCPTRTEAMETGRSTTSTAPVERPPPAKTNKLLAAGHGVTKESRRHASQPAGGAHEIV